MMGMLGVGRGRLIDQSTDSLDLLAWPCVYGLDIFACEMDKYLRSSAAWGQRNRVDSRNGY
jgi:hypothetical protein